MSDNRTRIWFSLFVLAVFCVGLATGLLIGRRIGLDVMSLLKGPICHGGFKRLN